VTAYVLFQSTQAAARADAVLRRAKLPARLVPTPRQLSSECGTALAFDATVVSAAEVETRLHEGEIPFVAIHVLQDQPVHS